MPRFNYIVTIHNKEDLIDRVVRGVMICAGEESHIYLVLDGCTDRTEEIVDRLIDDCVGAPISKLVAPNVHEIMSLNIALRQVPHEGDGYNILLQDDVILADWNFEKKVVAVNARFEDRIGVLSFHHGVNVVNDLPCEEIREVDLLESCYGQGMSDALLMPGYAARRMVGLRSPECISFDTIRQIGILDEKYAPYTYDDHDYGLRCLKAGRPNVIYAVKILSRVDWGGMRRKPQPGVGAIMKRNRRYVFQEHKEFVSNLSRDDFMGDPVRIEGDWPTESAESALVQYEESRGLLNSYVQRQRLNILRRIREKLAF